MGRRKLASAAKQGGTGRRRSSGHGRHHDSTWIAQRLQKSAIPEFRRSGIDQINFANLRVFVSFLNEAAIPITRCRVAISPATSAGPIKPVAHVAKTNIVIAAVLLTVLAGIFRNVHGAHARAGTFLERRRSGRPHCVAEARAPRPVCRNYRCGKRVGRWSLRSHAHFAKRR
ncbi:hypothetical protein LFL96_35925 (plasmid) [Paraburkholderia sp. D15]|uniref:hypothetical protein n=1 Tax=Paraburkholderia sp. D15 TaxID=2880218 RepID=UPI002479F65B|nr:hypothetical protein [Paraburkholderia sp. D15]WGS54892.1 hypothetical protein LFL96_35925 [Paraburkholderia sp. D15]